MGAEWQSHDNQNIWFASTTPNSRALPSCKILPCSEIRRATSRPTRLPFQPSSTMSSAQGAENPLDCRATSILCVYGLNPPCPLHSPRANFIFSSCLFKVLLHGTIRRLPIWSRVEHDVFRVDLASRFMDRTWIG